MLGLKETHCAPGRGHMGIPSPVLSQSPLWVRKVFTCTGRGEYQRLDNSLKVVKCCNQYWPPGPCTRQCSMQYKLEGFLKLAPRF